MKKLSLFLIALAMILTSCKPEVEKPTVVTKSVGEVTEISAKVVGQVTADGGAEVTERGVCWSTDGTPTILDYRVKDVEGGLGSYDVIFTDLVPNTQYYVRAYATNEVGTSYGEQKSFTTLDKYNGHEYVDLGLPSGLKWATCNVGASKPEEYGNYYAWGETSPKAEYTEENSITYGEEMNDISGNPQYDAARANWGGSWRMPREYEMEELLAYCEWEWTQMNGVNGYKVIGHNGKSIFLPAAGGRDESSLYDAGSSGEYLCSTPIEYFNDVNCAYDLTFYSDGQHVGDSYRWEGHSVRPVAE